MMNHSSYLATVPALRLLWIAGSWLAGILTTAATSACLAQATPPNVIEDTTREILVPIEDLKVLLESSPKRIMLSRKEFSDLRRRAQTVADEQAPLATAVLAADYQMNIDDGRAVVRGTLDVEVLREGLHVTELPFQGVSILSATLDGQPAPLGREGNGPVQMFVEGVGKHQLQLELVLPVVVSAAQQSLTFQIPSPPSAKMRISVPGNVEIKSGASVVRRQVDSENQTTSFEILVPKAVANITMSLNNRRLRDERAVVARSLIISRVQDAFESVDITISFGILHGAVSEVRFMLPQDLDITDIDGEWMDRWGIEQQADGLSTVRIDLRQAATQPFTLRVTAIRNRPITDAGTAWSFPALKILDVDGQVAVLGMAIEPQLRVRNIAAEQLIPIDRSVFADSVAGILVAFYAPSAGQFSLSASIQNPAPQLDAISSFLMTVGRRELTLDGGFVLEPQIRKVFSFDFAAPSAWTIQSIRDAQGKQLSFEEYAGENDTSLYHVRLPNGASPGDSYQVEVRASYVPAGWLSEWNSQEIAFPLLRIQDADIERGALAVAAINDLAIRPTTLTGLSVLTEQEKQEFGLTTASDLAYRFDAMPYAGSFSVEPTDSQLTARVTSFHKLSPQGLSFHSELELTVREATVRRFAFSLPESTPEEIGITGLRQITVKEFHSEVVDGRRVWEVLLADDVPLDGNRVGSLRVAVDFQRPFTADEQSPAAVNLPDVQVSDVVYQSGMISVEGHSELDVTVETDARRVDVGELSEAFYTPGRRLLGAYGYAGDSPDVTATISTRNGFRLPTVIVQRAEMFTAVGVNGAAQTVSRYRLQSKPTTVLVRLPNEAKIWSVLLNGDPLAPQQIQDFVMVNLSSTESNIHDLRVVFESHFSKFHIRGAAQAGMPLLFVVSEDGQQIVIPIADVQWQVAAPPGWSVSAEGGWTSEGTGDPIGLADVAKTWSAHVESAVESSMERNRLVYPAREAATAGGESMDGAMDDFEADFAGEGEGAEMEEEAAARETPSQSNDAEPAPQAPADPFAANPAPAETTANQADGDQSESGRRASGRSQGRDQSPGFGDQGGFGDQVWALQGMRSLPIDWSSDFEELNDVTTFYSLGGNPEIQLQLVDRNRVAWLAAAAFLLTLVTGFVMAFRTLRQRIRFFAVAAVAAILIPVVANQAEWTAVKDGILLGLASSLVVQVLLGIAARVRRHLPNWVTVTTAALVVVCWQPALHGQTSRDDIVAALKNLAGGESVELPEDAVIVPFTSDNAGLPTNTDELLVPYAVYTKLRALADSQSSNSAPPVVPYALAGAQYQTTLIDNERLEGERLEGDHLEIEGTLRYRVFTKSPVTVPLPFSGGVVVEALVNDRPARLQLFSHEAGEKPPNQGPDDQAANHPAENGPAMQQQQGKSQQSQQREVAPVLTVLLDGKGMHTLQWKLRFPMSRQGGWRRLEGRLPVAAASSFAVSVPQANTDVRFANIPDRSNHTTTEDGETIRVALPETGMILLQFRPQVAAAEVDRSLTARSEGVFDVQEDGLRLAWQIQYEFRQGRRSTLSAILPSGYLLEKVLGDNVRGWDVNDTGRLDVELLKDVTEQEAITVFLSRRRRLLDGDSAEIELPLVGVPDAMLHTGTVSVRRSPRLELSVGQQVQLIRDNGDAAAAERLMKLAGEESSPLTIRPFQTFRFASENYSATVTARSIADRTEANVESIVRISPRQTEWEMRVQFDVKQIPRHVVELDLPAEFEIRSLSQADWVTSTTEGRQTVTVYLGSAESGPFDLVLNGVLPPMGGDGNVALPSVLVADVVRQTGELVVQVDPAYRVQPTNLDGAAVVPLERANDWLTPEQFALARGGIVLQLSKADYQGNLLVTRREPDVRVTTLTNVKVTDQSIEETILLEFRVLEAGIRDVRFRLPASMAAARFRVPSLRAKSVAPAANAPELVDVLLEFQDDLMDEIRIVIENDRLASSGPQTVPIPRIQTGIVEQQYVTLQNQGRDELIVESAEGLTALANSQRRWRSLVDLDITQGYEVNRGATDPLLQFRSQVRETLKTADARIDHSEITIVVDAAGTYRAKHLFYVENNTEPYLQIQLPTDSSLWTTHVDGQPVKPAVVPDQEREVRIPLVRTQLGDSDYPVQVIYAGSIENLTSLSQVKFPFVRTVNINVERTQVALHLPEDFRWINFRGATQTNREEFALGFQMYLEKEIASQAQNLKSGSKYQQQRAAATLRQLEEQVQQSAQEAVDDGKLARQQLRNWQSVEDAQRAAMEQAEQSQVEGLETDNRAALNDLFSNQRYNRATNIVTNKGDNFEDAYRVVDESKDQAGAAAEEGQFNKKWLGSNSLSLDGHADAKRTDSKPSSKGKSEKAQAAAERTQANRRGINNNAAFDNIQRQIDRLNQTRQSGEQQMERLPAGENVFDGPANAGNGQQRGGGRGPGLDRSSPQFDLGFLRDAPRGNTRQGQAGGGFGAQQQMGQAAMPAGMAGQASGQGLGFDEDDSPPFAATSNAETTGSLASVDLEIPERGTVFYFQATRGKVELTAQPVNSSSSWNLATFIACLIGLAVVWFATRQSDSN